MRSMLVILALAVACSGCASLRPAGKLDIGTILTDAQYGLLAACAVEWLPQQECLVGTDAINAGQAIVAKNGPGTAAAVRQALVDAEKTLAADSRLRPYLDAAIALL